MSSADFNTILDSCILRIQAGESLGRCLADHPQMAAELQPLLSLSADLVRLEPLVPAPAVSARGRDLMFAAFDEPDQTAIGSQWSVFGLLLDQISGWFGPQAQMGLVGRLALVLVGLVVSGGFITSASADSLPGDGLYPVKRIWESAQLTFTFNPATRVAFEEELNDLRKEEVRQLQAAGREANVAFSGKVESITADEWIIDGIIVEPNPSLPAIEEVFVGQTITIDSQIGADGVISIEAIQIQPSEPKPVTGPTSTPTATPETDNQQPTVNNQLSTDTPTVRLTSTPANTPTNEPTGRPTDVPASVTPTIEPTVQPTNNPTNSPTSPPTTAPSATATARPPTVSTATAEPIRPSAVPSQVPSAVPSATVTQPPSIATPRPTGDGSIRATHDANATIIAEAQATRAAIATTAAELQMTQQAINEAAATNQANVQATRATNATANANGTIDANAKATAQANAQMTQQALATQQANAQATQSALATHAANIRATRDAIPTQTPVRDNAPTSTPDRDR